MREKRGGYVPIPHLRSLFKIFVSSPPPPLPPPPPPPHTHTHFCLCFSILAGRGQRVSPLGPVPLIVLHTSPSLFGKFQISVRVLQYEGTKYL